MAKKFVVRLRKGSPAGNIVANSQVITISDLAGTNIFPSNFEDLRLQGRVTTLNRTAYVLKNIAYPLTTTTTTPPTTTSTTTIAPDGTTTTTTLGPGQTTTTTTQALGTYSISFTPAEVLQSESMTVTISHPGIPAGTTLFLGIRGGEGPLFRDQTVGGSRLGGDGLYRPDVTDITSPVFTRLTTTSNIIKTPFNVSGQTSTVTIQFTTDRQKSQWLQFLRNTTYNDKFSDWQLLILSANNSILYTHSVKPTIKPNYYNVAVYNSGNQYLLAYPQANVNSPETLLSALAPLPNSVDVKVRFYALITGVTNSVKISLSGLKAGESYSLKIVNPGVLPNHFAVTFSDGVKDTWVTSNQGDRWKQTEFLTIDGKTVNGDNNPNDPAIANKNIFYPFTASATTKDITLVFSDKFNFYTTVTKAGLSQSTGFIYNPSTYEFGMKLTNLSGSGDTNDGVYYRWEHLAARSIVVTDGYIKHRVDMSGLGSALTKGNTTSAVYIGITGANATLLNQYPSGSFSVPFDEAPINLGSQGRRFVVSFFAETATTAGTLNVELVSSVKAADQSNTSKTNVIIETNPSGSYPGQYKIKFDVTSMNVISFNHLTGSSDSKLQGVVLKVTAPSDTVIDWGLVKIKVFSYLIENQSTFNFTTTDPKFLLADISDAFRVVASTASGAVATPVITNWTMTPNTYTFGEVSNRQFSVKFTVTDNQVRTVYWKLAGGVNITASDFEGPNYGNFNTIVGSGDASSEVKIRNDGILENTETFNVYFYLSVGDRDADRDAFYVSPTITITDGSAEINEIVKIADADVPPYYVGDNITFIISGGIPNDTVDLFDGVTKYPSVTLDASGNLTATPGPFNDIRLWELEVTFKATGHVRKVSWTIEARPRAGSGGCPDPLTPILISPTEAKPAGDIKVGDLIWTMHEHSLEYGYYSVVYAQAIEEPKLKFTFTDNTTLTVSLSHKFLVPNRSWTSARDLRPGNAVEGVNGLKTIQSLAKLGIGTVILMEIDQAHTYIAGDCISHNKQITSILEIPGRSNIINSNTQFE